MTTRNEPPAEGPTLAELLFGVPGVPAPQGVLTSGKARPRMVRLVPPGDAAHPVAAGRNEPCPCGGGRKFKHCCLRRAQG